MDPLAWHPSPPWQLQNPHTGLPLHVQDWDHALQLMQSWRLTPWKIKNPSNFRELVEPERNKTRDKRRASCEGWLHTADVRWLFRHGMKCPLPTIGPTWGKDAGKLFWDTIASKRADMFGLTFAQTKALLEHGKEASTAICTWQRVPPPPGAATIMCNVAFVTDAMGSWFDVGDLSMV